MTEENLNQQQAQENTQEESQQEGVEQSNPEPEKDSQKESEGINAIALLSYLGILVLVPLLAAKDDEFAQYHAKQGLTLFIAWIVGMFIGVVPIIGWALVPIIFLTCFVLFVIGIINVVKKQKKELPIIGKYAKNFKI